MCSRTRYTLRTRTTYAQAQAQAFPSVAAYASASRSAMHTPSGCDGNRTRYGRLAKPWPVDLRPHPTILFWLGNLTQWWADGRPLLAWCQQFSGCTPRPSLNTGVTTRALCTQGISHCLHRCCRRAGRTSPKLARYHCNQGNFPCPGTGYRRFFSPPIRPI